MANLTKQLSSAPFLLKLISEQKLFADKLTSHQRLVCARFLLTERKHTQNEIATILGVSYVMVHKYKKKIQQQNEWMIDEIDERRMALDILQSAETASARLFRKGKDKEAFEVQRMAIDTLQTLGYLKRAPVEFKGQITLQEILKLANGPDPEDETLLSERTGRGGKEFIPNGSG